MPPVFLKLKRIIMTEQQLLREFLNFIRERYEDTHREILIGEDEKNPEFVIVPYKRESTK